LLSDFGTFYGVREESGGKKQKALDVENNGNCIGNKSFVKLL
jgi:hypothetical protein